MKITMHSIIQLTYQLWSHGVPSFFTLPFSLSPVIAEPQTGIIWRKKTTPIVGVGRKLCPFLRILGFPTTKPRGGSTAQLMKVHCRSTLSQFMKVHCRNLNYSKTPFWFRTATNISKSNVILRARKLFQCPNIEDFYFLKIQSWASLRKCTVRLVRTLQVTDVYVPFFWWFNNLRNCKNISSEMAPLEMTKKLLTISYQKHYFYSMVLRRIYILMYWYVQYIRTTR